MNLDLATTVAASGSGSGEPLKPHKLAHQGLVVMQAQPDAFREVIDDDVHSVIQSIGVDHVVLRRLDHGTDLLHEENTWSDDVRIHASEHDALEHRQKNADEYEAGHDGEHPGEDLLGRVIADKTLKGW